MKSLSWWSACLLVLVVSCAPERYPLEIRSGKAFLVTHDRTGQEVWFAVDTGSSSSFVHKAWAVRAGGRLVDGPPAVWSGFNLWDEGSHRLEGLAPLPGVPNMVNGLAVMDDPGRSPLDDPFPVVGLLGTDVLWDWVLDFRGDTPWLVHGAVDDPRQDDRIPYDLKISGGHYTLSMQWYPGPDVDHATQVTWTNELIVDTGCPAALVGFMSEPPKVGGVVNQRGPSANGLTTILVPFDGFRVGSFLVPPFLGLVGVTGGSGSTFLTGPPALRALRAVVDLRHRTFSFSRQVQPLEVTSQSPEAWAWHAEWVEGQGVVLGQILPGSTLARRGWKTGDTVAAVNGERLDQPRSVLEWNRAWMALALGEFSP